MASSCPRQAARSSAVSPDLLRAWRSAPRLSITSNPGTFPAHAAECRGVSPNALVAVEDAPASSSTRMRSGECAAARSVAGHPRLPTSTFAPQEIRIGQLHNAQPMLPHGAAFLQELCISPRDCRRREACARMQSPSAAAKCSGESCLLLGSAAWARGLASMTVVTAPRRD